MTLRLDEVAVHYGQRCALRPCTLELETGEVLALIGPNGAGKTSLLKAIAGLTASQGQVSWQGRVLAQLNPRARARTVAYLPQAAQSHWPVRVCDLVALGRLPHRRYAAPPSEGDRDAVSQAMRETRVEELSERMVAELSGGEHARVHMARALAVQAPVLLVDEPVASVDPYHQLQIMAVLEGYARRGGLVVAVMHDLALAARFCTRMTLLDEGSMVAHGTPAEVLDPANLRKHYRVEPYLAQHEGQPVVVPWRTLD